MHPSPLLRPCEGETSGGPMQLWAQGKGHGTAVSEGLGGSHGNGRRASPHPRRGPPTPRLPGRGPAGGVCVDGRGCAIRGGGQWGVRGARPVGLQVRLLFSSRPMSWGGRTHRQLVCWPAKQQPAPGGRRCSRRRTGSGRSPGGRRSPARRRGVRGHRRRGSVSPRSEEGPAHLQATVGVEWVACRQGGASIGQLTTATP